MCHNSDELHIALVQSSKPHANLLTVDTSEAFKMPGVASILTGNDDDIPTIEPPLFAKGVVSVLKYVSSCSIRILFVVTFLLLVSPTGVLFGLKMCRFY